MAETAPTTKAAATNGKEEILVSYKSGGVNVRRVISKADWKSLDIEMEGQTVWEKRNNWTLTGTNWPVAAIKWLENDGNFKVERHPA